MDTLEEAESNRTKEEEVQEPAPVVYGQQLMLTAGPTPIVPQPGYQGYGYATPGYAPPTYGFNVQP